MSISNKLFAIADPGLSLDVTVTGDAGSDRYAVAFGLQYRNPINLSTFTLDGTAPTGFLVQDASAGLSRVIMAYWLDADLPAVAGTYTVAAVGPDNSTRISVVTCTDASQVAPATVSASVENIDYSETLSVDDGSLLVSGVVLSQSGTVAVDSDMASFGLTDNRRYAYYNETSKTISYSTDFTNIKTVIIAAIPPVANTSPAVTPDDSTLESGSALTWTTDNLGTLTSATLTDSNGNVVSLTSVTDTGGTCPNFTTAAMQACLYGDVTLTVDDGADTATATIELTQPSGYNLATGSSLDESTTDELDWNYGTDASDGTQCVLPDPFTPSSSGAIVYDVDDVTPLPYTITGYLIATDGVVSTVTITFEAESTDQPVLADTQSYSASISRVFSRTLSQLSGEAATSWTITGGANQLDYSLSNVGVLSRNSIQSTITTEVVTVIASNDDGDSNTQTVTINYIEGGNYNPRTINISRNRIGI